MINRLKEIRNRVSKSNDGKVLASNFGYMVLLQAAGYLFPLVTIPYLARVVGVDGFGKIAFAAAIVLWFELISDWGFNYTATRDVAKNRDDLGKVSEIFSNVLWARILLMMLSFAVLLAATTFVPLLKENQKVILLTFLFVPGNIIFPRWFFQAVEKMKLITIFNLASRVVFTVMVFIFITEKEDFVLQPVFMSLGYLVCGLVSMYLIVVKWKVKVQAPNWRSIIFTIRNGTDVFLHNLMPNLCDGFSVVLLGVFGGSVSTGLLDAGKKFVEIAQSFSTVVARVFFPFLSRKIEKHNLYMVLHLSIACLFFLSLSVFAPLIIRVFYTPEFEPAVLVLQIMALSVIFLSLVNIYGVNYMIIEGHEKRLRNITSIASVIGLFIAFPLVYYFDYVGAALAITLARVLLGVIVMLRAVSIKRMVV